MNDIETQLKLLKNIQPKQEILRAVRERVFRVIRASEFPSAPVLSPIAPLQRSPLSMWHIFATSLMVFIAIVANQLPMYGAYDNSITAIADASRAAEILEQKGDVSSAEGVLSATKDARETLATLKLKGLFGVYTQEQCFRAYTIYDSYLDYVADYLDGQKPTDVETQKTFAELRAYVEESRNEVKQRLTLYPDMR